MEFFLDENHLRGKKSEVYFGSIFFILDARGPARGAGEAQASPHLFVVTFKTIA